MAVMSTARLGAARSGLYARPSIITPSTVQTTMASSTPTHQGRPSELMASSEI